jgi:cold shock CspA family protein
MKGQIKSYASEKHYGFIEGIDGKNYYFQSKDFLGKESGICEELFVEFEQVASPRGNQAVKIAPLDEKTVGYIAPDQFLYSETNSIKGWTVVEPSNWTVTCSSETSGASLDGVKEELKQRAKMIHANAMIDLRYSRSTGSEDSNNGNGTHYFTIHTYTARAVNVAKKNANGKLKLEDFQTINKTAEGLKADWKNQYEMERDKNKVNIIRWFKVLVPPGVITMFFMGIPKSYINSSDLLGLLFFVASIGTLVSLVMLAIFLFSFWRTKENGLWLVKKN